VTDIGRLDFIRWIPRLQVASSSGGTHSDQSTAIAFDSETKLKKKSIPQPG
jgi:hypothetical protein